MRQRPAPTRLLAAIVVVTMVVTMGAVLALWLDDDAGTEREAPDPESAGGAQADDPGGLPVAPIGNVTCEVSLPRGAIWLPTDVAELNAEYEAQGAGEPIRIDRTCVDRATGQVVRAETIDWTPTMGDPAVAPTGEPAGLAESTHPR